MKRTLILFASKAGTTRRAAERLSRALASACDCYDLRKRTLQTANGAVTRVNAANLDFAQYDVLALGSAMYMGKPLKAFTQFAGAQTAELLKPPLLLFTCGIGTQQDDQPYLWANLPESVTAHALGYYHLGGELSEKGGWLNRMVLKEYISKNGKSPALDEKAFAAFCSALDSAGAAEE